MDVAALALDIESSSVVKAAGDLDRFSAAAARAGAAAGKISTGSTGNTARMAQDYARAAEKAAQYSGAAMRAAAANDNVAATAQKMASANDNAGRALAAADAHVVAYTQHLAQLAAAQGDANAHVLAYQRHLQTTAPVLGQADAHIQAYRKHIEGVGQAIKFTARDGLNFSRQAADIGVTAAMGMSPFLIALQQGPQLFDILQEKAVATGTSIGTVFRAAGAAVWAAMAPLLPLLLAIAAAVAVVTAAFALGAREINKGQGKVVDGLSLTEKQLKKLEKKGVETSVTMGDTFFAFFKVLGDRIAWLLEGPLKSLSDGWNWVMDNITHYGSKAIEFIVGGFVGAVYAVKAAWNLLPAAIGDTVIRAANWVISTLERMINASIDLINGLLANLPDWLTGGSTVAIGHVSFGQLDDQFAGGVEKFGAAVGAGFKKGMDESRDMMGRFWSDVDKQAQKNARERILNTPGLPGPDKGRKGGKSDAEKLADIYLRARAETAIEESRAKAVGMSARAAADLEQRTKLLNQIEKAGIPITAAVRAEVSKLAKAYADAKIAADTAVAIQGVTDNLEKQRRAITDETKLIGLYGDALIRAGNAADALRTAREALPKGESLGFMDTVRVTIAAGRLSDAEIEQNRARRAEDLRKSAEDMAFALGLEEKGLYLTGEAAIAYAFTADYLNDAKRRRIELTPGYVASIEAAGAAYAKQRYTIDRTARAIADARDVTKGFFTDWMSSVRQGANVFKAFADSVVNSLNRILDKMLDRSFDAFFDKMLSGGRGSGGGFLNGLASFAASLFGGGGASSAAASSGMNFANGMGAFGFAKGGAFTNRVIDTPTLFRFARGAALGEMGEAGPEAVMPLSRDSSGRLGVQAHGGGRPVIRMGDVHNQFSFAGAVGLEGIAALVRQGGEATYNQIKRDLESLLQQLGDDGTFVS